MKILIVGPFSSPIIQRLSINLRNTGYKVLIASYNADDSTDVKSLGTVKSIFDYFKFYKINKIVKDFEPDIIHAHNPNHYGLMCIFQRKPLLVALWGSDIMIAPYSKNPLKNIFYRTLNWIVIKRATRCHTSAEHIALEADKQCKGALNKTDIYYWGFPLPKPENTKIEVISNTFKEEFNLFEDELIVFPRGLASVYNPKIVAKIIKHLLAYTKLGKKIVVLKGFATSSDENAFKELVDISSITYIDRLLSADELYYLYSKTSIHFSIPTSDSLGGGVIEPALFGSFPILSNLHSYNKYAKDNQCLILKGYDKDTLNSLCRDIERGKIGHSVKNIPRSYSLSNVLDNLDKTYEKVKGKA